MGGWQEWPAARRWIVVAVAMAWAAATLYVSLPFQRPTYDATIHCEPALLEALGPNDPDGCRDKRMGRLFAALMGGVLATGVGGLAFAAVRNEGPNGERA